MDGLANVACRECCRCSVVCGKPILRGDPYWEATHYHAHAMETNRFHVWLDSSYFPSRKEAESAADSSRGRLWSDHWPYFKQGIVFDQSRWRLDFFAEVGGDEEAALNLLMYQLFEGHLRVLEIEQRILDGDLSAVPDTWTVTLHDNQGKEMSQAQIGAIRARQLEARRRGVRPPLSAEAQEIRNRREWFKARIEKLRQLVQGVSYVPFTKFAPEPPP